MTGRQLFAGGSGPIEEIRAGGKAEYFVRIGNDLVPFYRAELEDRG